MEQTNNETQQYTGNTSDSLWIIDTSYNSNDKIIIPYLIKTLNVVAITTIGSGLSRDPNTIKSEIEKDIGSKIPIFAGADRPFINYQKELRDDELVNPYNYDNKTITKSDNSNTDNQDIGHKLANTAAVKIVEFIITFNKRVNVLALGALTNLSLAVLIDSSIKDLANNIYVVGGSYNNLGNSGSCAEYNFRADPVASKNVVLYYHNLVLIPLEIEEQVKSYLKSDTNTYTGIKSLVDRLSKDDQTNEKPESVLGILGGIVAINAGTVKTKSVKPCDVDIYGRFTRGALLVEKYPHLKTGKYNDVTIVDEVNVAQIFEIANKIFS